jgi:hypothetical protein
MADIVRAAYFNGGEGSWNCCTLYALMLEKIYHTTRFEQRRASGGVPEV